MFTLFYDRRIILMGSILVILIFLSLNLHYTGGEIILPLDDSYIYAQYSKSIVEGHPFRFTPESEPSTGVTGLLYPFILAPFYLLGFRGALFPAFIFFFNGILFIISSLLVYELAGGKNNRNRARLGAWLFILSGPMAWGFLSGMETGILIITWLCLAIALDRGKETTAIFFASMIVLIRPIGLFWCFILWIVLPLLPQHNQKKKTTRIKWLIPLAIGLLPILVNVALSGSISPSSGYPKSPFSLPGLHLPTILQHTISFLLTLFKQLLTGFSGPELHGSLNTLDPMCHAAPFTLLFLLFALLPVLGKILNKRYFDKKVIWALWFLTNIFWVAITTGASSHYFRHLLPVWPAIILLTVEGISALSASLKIRGFNQPMIFRGFGIYFIFFGFLTIINFALLHGKAVHGFARQYLDTARWIDQNLDKNARIASLDAGLLGYFSNREFFDLFGLTTPAMQEVTVFYADDEGTKFEIMERLPSQLRPSHFVLHKKRFDHNNWNPYLALLKFDKNGKPRIIHSARVLIPAILIGTDLQVWEADWSLANSGDRPGSPIEGVIVDRVDIADTVSEKKHGINIKNSAPGFLGSNQFHKLPSEDGYVIMDGGRGIFGSLSMHLSRIHQGKDLIIRMRILPVVSNNKLEVYVNGKPIGNWFFPTSKKGRWLEPMIILKSTIITEETIHLTLSGTFMPFHLWAIEKN